MLFGHRNDHGQCEFGAPNGCRSGCRTSAIAARSGLLALVAGAALASCSGKTDLERCTASAMRDFNRISANGRVETDRRVAEARARALCDQQVSGKHQVHKG